MKNKIKLTIIIFAVSLTYQMVNAQKLTKETLKAEKIEQHKAIVKQALTYNDAPTAINSLHHIIAMEGENSTYKDSLAIVYYNTGRYSSSHLLSKELLAKEPNNLQLLEINAVSLQQLGAVKEAIDAYETLFAKTNNMAHGYQLAMLQYNIKRLAEAQLTVGKALACEELENAMLQFPIDKTQAQNVPLKAAAHNLQGLISFELKQYDEASNAFAKALEIMPEFALATQNANAVLVQKQNDAKIQREAQAETNEN